MKNAMEKGNIVYSIRGLSYYTLVFAELPLNVVQGPLAAQYIPDHGKQRI